ncbi:MAG: hypothetical protein IPL12_15425 [Bacteroidetes bacterium]|nr:hypothetical protein [Bacteroidota bacterium]
MENTFPTPSPAFYKYPIANIFFGKGVDNLLKFSDEEPVLKIIEPLGFAIIL